MPFKEFLGSNESFYLDLLPEIRPHLKDLKQKNPKRYFQYQKVLLDIKPEIDEDIIAISDKLINRLGAEFEIEKIEEIPGQGLVNYKELTSYGCLREDVNATYKNWLRKGIIHYGPGIEKEPIILFLFLQVSKVRHKEIRIKLDDSFSLDELKKTSEAEHYLYKRYAKKHGWCYIYDEYEYLIRDDDRWYRSYTEEWQNMIKCLGSSLNVELKTARWRVFAIVEDVAFRLKAIPVAKLVVERLKVEVKKDITPYNWITLCTAIYSIQSVEKMLNLKILRSDPELRKIWGIPRTTYRDRMNFISSIDKF